MTFTLADAGWLAGLIDGEGTVSLVRHPENGRPILRIVVYSSDHAILDKLHRLLDVLGINYTDRWDRRHERPNCHVVMTTAGVRSLAPTVLPHMVRHAARLRTAIEFLEPCYQGRARVHWTTAQVAEWEGIRRRFNAA